MREGAYTNYVALSPSIPTSFVPKQPVAPKRRSSGNDLLLLISILILGLGIFASVATFAYDAYLQSVVKDKEAKLIAARKDAQEDEVKGFVQLRNRLNASRNLLDQHVAMSQVFDMLENTTLVNTRFDSMSIQVADDRSASITIAGSAKNFNALAAESKSFAAQKYVKSAIFSGIRINADGTIGFSINATLDPKVVIQGGEVTAPAASVSTTTTPASPSLPTVAPLKAATSTAGTAATSTATTTKAKKT
jgi:hypothetical protein